MAERDLLTKELLNPFRQKGNRYVHAQQISWIIYHIVIYVRRDRPKLALEV
jgi:hypothetical protein